MFPSYVALVPYESSSKVSLDDLTRVAAALQVQLDDDFGPLWGVSGTVSAFPSLEEIPAEYLPMVVIDKDIPGETHGFHFTVAGVPFALVRYEDNREWSLAASHELLETVLDPSGTLTSAGPSLQDGASVDYLVEVCDPCEHSTYNIDGVKVSEFVTPHYYSPKATKGSRYSFLRSVEKPRQVLGQGYLTWRTRLPENQLYQAIGRPRGNGKGDGGGSAPAGAANTEPDPTKPFEPPTIEKVPYSPTKMTRATITLTKARRGAIHGSSGGPSSSSGRPRNSFGAALREDIGVFLDYARQWETARPPTIDEIITVVGALGAGGKTPPADYDKVLAYLKEQKKASRIFGPDLMDPGMALWMAMHIG